MAGAVERFRRAAEAQGLSPDIRTFPEGTKTADAAAKAVGCDVAQIVKSLVFVVDGRPLVALTSGANRADPDRLAALKGAGGARRATPEEAREATGFSIGGTPPFGHPDPLSTSWTVTSWPTSGCGLPPGLPTPCSRPRPTSSFEPPGPAWLISR